MPHPKAADRQLLFQVKSGNVRGVRVALGGGARVDGFGQGEERPLMAAANLGKVDIMKLLVDRGADVDASISGGIIGAGGQVLLTGGSTAVHTAVYGDQAEALRFLIEAGADLNAADDEGMTPLMGVNAVEMAAKRRVMTEEMINAGADPTVSNLKGAIPLHFAAQHSNLDIIDRLLSEAPSTINRTNNDGVTPMCIAALKGQEKAVLHLLSLGASDKATLDDNNMSALFMAAQEGHSAVCRILIGKGLEAVGGLETIPEAIRCAIQFRQERILPILLAVGGDTNWAKCCLRTIPLIHLAASEGSLAATHILLAAGADETAVNKHGRSTIDTIGLTLPAIERNTAREDAIRRMLYRGPAFRAVSWSYPAETGGSAVAVVPLREKPKLPGGVLVFRPRCQGFFTARAARFSLK
ncbi:unnamed protein product [Scytosiphon promiscuus]